MSFSCNLLIDGVERINQSFVICELNSQSDCVLITLLKTRTFLGMR